jgi:hypothetical protein
VVITHLVCGSGRMRRMTRLTRRKRPSKLAITDIFFREIKALHQYLYFTSNI